MKMQDPVNDGVLVTLLAKFIPAGIGAAMMCAFDMPKTKKEWFWRAFVAFSASYLFGDVAFAWMESIPWLAFIDEGNRKHHTAVDGLIGATSFLVMNGLSSFLKKWKSGKGSSDFGKMNK